VILAQILNVQVEEDDLKYILWFQSSTSFEEVIVIVNVEGSRRRELPFALNKRLPNI
jgi:hypothetical protein